MIRTNGIKIRDPNHDTMYGIFEVACRINHSCLPNTYSSWVSEKGTIEIYATQSIPQGEEITSTSIGDLGVCGLRQECLAYIFKFTCRCRLCIPPEEDQESSDFRIQ